ncbi:response regulator [Ferrovum sp.]|jgi:CheY-like chemotaxis protein|uniref:response regulator n=1 Tax=Ferrovum sp. TaxID=2609467 RepID=UPI00262D7730|nr:response regulator [Ferrovum sp.]MBW8065862.1 response regulator [Ferrovum sp.]
MSGLMGRPAEFLLVEDNPGDVRLTKEALAESKLYNNLNVVPDGLEALRFLRQDPPYENAPRPDVILLDLNLPKIDGREVLATIKSTPEFKRIPVVVISSSEAEADILRSYDLHVNCYVTKPVNLDQFIKVVQSIESFWLTIVKLPQISPES